MITGNKGEWSEIYTLLKILADKNLYLGDEDLIKVQDVVYPIIKILRTEFNRTFEYSIKDDLVFIISDEEEIRITIEDFREKALFLLDKLKKDTKRTFSIPEIEDFMKKIKCSSLTAGSSSKTDITIMIHDLKTNQQPVLGFSIKSQLGSPSTLLNAGKRTNFIYEIENIILNEKEIDKINSIQSKNKIKERIGFILKQGGSFSFVKPEKEIFFNNLILIDSLLPNILAEFLLNYFLGKASALYGLVDIIEQENPLNFDKGYNHNFYDYKIKRFLTDIALGMMPSEVWTGKYDATGGYLVVKETGDILCYHIYNKNEFENYLLKNTKLETASSARHDFGYIYEENGKQYFKLNLQVRFLK